MELLTPQHSRSELPLPLLPSRSIPPHKRQKRGQTGKGDRALRGMKEMRINSHRALAEAGQSPAHRSAGEDLAGDGIGERLLCGKPGMPGSKAA